MLHNQNSTDRILPPLVNRTTEFPSLTHFRGLSLFIELPLCLALLMMSLVLTASTIGILFLPLDRTDPLSPYETIMPGQPRKALSAYNCPLPYIMDSGHLEMKPVCVLALDKGVIHSIVVYAHDEEITRVSFAIRNMRVVDLVWRWGQPDRISQDAERYLLIWNHPVYAIVRIQGRYSPQARVQNISILDPDLHQLSTLQELSRAS
jgi:hypothetical protein